MYNQPCLVRVIITDLNPFELNYYPFIVISNKCDVSCNTFDDLFDRFSVPN